MKIRTDFVTNSSSSSYICEICHEVESGYDLSLRDTDMVICENGHVICNRHLKNDSPRLITAQVIRLFCSKNIDHYFNLKEEATTLSQQHIQEKLLFFKTLMKYAEDIGELYDNSSSYYCNISSDDIESLDESIISEEDKDILLEDHDLSDEIRENYPADFCPICQLEVIPDSKLIQYLLKELKIDKQELVEKLGIAYKHNYVSFTNALSKRID